MQSFFDQKTLEKLSTPEITNALSNIHEYRGKQSLFLHAESETLDALVQIAKIQSTDASNRIEGIHTTSLRLKQLVEEKTTPKNRSEQELAGYRDVLKTLHEHAECMPLSANLILQLHRDLFAWQNTDEGGRWKNTDNLIAQTDTQGHLQVRFQPTSCAETPFAVEQLCHAYHVACQRGRYDSLLLIALLILDFLCIHPFRDGNGRISRLLTVLLLYQTGYWVGKYISLEQIIEQSKETYHEVLHASSFGWHEGNQNPVPFVGYLLGVILKAYHTFESRISLVTLKRTSKGERIRHCFETTRGPLSKQDIFTECPDISITMIEKTLKSLLDEGIIEKFGRGKRTTYCLKP